MAVDRLSEAFTSRTCEVSCGSAVDPKLIVVVNYSNFYSCPAANLYKMLLFLEQLVNDHSVGIFFSLLILAVLS
uniref:Uncharacterized protein n=1 Tax=Physcomitrium patens TaxID=3218 RepID=A0A2K1L828_PHYPA|nr:hypothetical protein PHYPA_000568 [Physcomitrium patens]